MDLNGLPIDHIGVAVHSIEEAAPTFELISGARRSAVEALPSQDVQVCFVGRVELIEPTSPDSSTARFLQRRGVALHHIAYAVDDLTATLTRMEKEGFELIDTEPRRGAGGHRVAFLHPRSTGKILIELVESGTG